MPFGKKLSQLPEKTTPVVDADLLLLTDSDDGLSKKVTGDKLPEDPSAKWLDPVRVRTTANVNLASGLAAGQTIDGIVLVAGDRVLAMVQDDATEVGIYVAPASGAASRAGDLPVGAFASLVCVLVDEGTAHEDTAWICTTNKGADEVGTDQLAFGPFPASASAHASTHISGGGDPIAGCDLACGQTPSHFTPTSATIGGMVEGIDAALAPAANGAVRQDGNGDAAVVRDLAVGRDLDIEGDFTVNPLGVGGFDAATIDNDTGNFTTRGTLSVAAGNFSVNGAGNVTLAGTLDGRDVAADGAKLDTIETNADVTDAANVAAAGALMDAATLDLSGYSLARISYRSGEATFTIDQDAVSAGVSATSLVLRGGTGGTPSGAAAQDGGVAGVYGGAGGAGNGSFAAGNGNQVQIYGGDAGANGGAGGANGGTVVIEGGTATGAGTNGSVAIGISSPTASVEVGRNGFPVKFYGYTQHVEQTSAPSALANNIAVYSLDDGSGNTNLWAKFPTGTTRRVATGTVRALGTSTFSVNSADDGGVCNWTGTSTGVAGTIDQGSIGQVTTLVLTGTAGTVTLTAGSGVTLEPEEGKTLTTNAPGASTAVTVSLIWLTATHVVATGGLA